MSRDIVGSQFSVTEAMSFSACAARIRFILLMEHPCSRNSLQKATAPPPDLLEGQLLSLLHGLGQVAYGGVEDGIERESGVRGADESCC